MVLKGVKWIDLDHGLVDRSIFVDEEIYQQELEQVFGRSWLFVGHESQIPNAGDFVTTTMGEEPVIVSRDKSGVVHAYLNSCRHRGNAVTRANLGNCSSFMCSYHGWTYDSSGALISVPGYKELYHEDMIKGTRDDWGLIKVPRVESFHGLIFANWDETAPGLVEYLGEYGWFLEARVDPQGHGSEVDAVVLKWTMNHNWKFAADNFVGDIYHTTITHKSANLAGHRTRSLGGAQAPAEAEAMREGGRYTEAQSNPDAFRMATKYGHGGGFTLRPADAPLYRGEVSEQMATYLQQRRDAIEQRLGPNRARISAFDAMFPNFSINSSAEQIHVWHPRGPQKTESWIYFLFDKAAPEEVKRQLVWENSRHFGPAGMFEQDDADNWILSTKAATSAIARRHPLHYGMGLKDNNWLEPKEDLPLRRQGTWGETNQLNFYRVWQDMMWAKSWDELRSQPFEPV